MFPTCKIKVLIQPHDTAQTLQEKAKVIFQTYSKTQIVGYAWDEIVENEYVIIKITYAPN